MHEPELKVITWKAAPSCSADSRVVPRSTRSRSATLIAQIHPAALLSAAVELVVALQVRWAVSSADLKQYLELG